MCSHEGSILRQASTSSCHLFTRKDCCNIIGQGSRDKASDSHHMTATIMATFITQDYGKCLLLSSLVFSSLLNFLLPRFFLKTYPKRKKYQYTLFLDYISFNLADILTPQAKGYSEWIVVWKVSSGQSWNGAYPTTIEMWSSTVEELNTSQDPFQYSSVWGHCVMKGAVFSMRIKGKDMF